MVKEKATMTVKEMAEYLGIGKASAYRLIREGQVPALKIGRQFRIPIACIDEWVMDQVTDPKTVSTRF